MSAHTSVEPTNDALVVRRIPAVSAVAPAPVWYEPGKTVVDFVAALILIVFLVPVFVLIALAVKLTSRGPVLFVQPRIGRHGETFSFLKFRSMADGAHHDHEEVVGSPHEYNAETAAADPRVTAVGSFLRKTSLDELPQLFNVLAGHMSLVGPRPIMTSEAEHLDTEHHARHDVKPGLTGLWQVSGRKQTSWEDRMKLDLTYVSERSPALDARLLVKTAKVLVTRDGAV